MPNEYSIEIHDHLTRLIETVRGERETARENKDASAESYWCGQLDELDWIRDYLKENIDLKNFTYY